MAEQKHEVILHVYDLSRINEWINLLSQDMGVYHTGTEVYGKEYSFGGHPYDLSGIFITTPKDIESLSVNNVFKYKESKAIGYTELSEEKVQQIVTEMGRKGFKGKDYNLIQKNCNHFSDEFCKRLCGNGIPKEINTLAETIAQYPWIERQIPVEFVTPQALENDIKQERERDLQKQDKQESTDSVSDSKE
ncbi:unnamed protein product [Oppiella nova]|uniref:PPPDE domain-containing protein n=1 Tax=Oppiella nova TaxID=334625 RepID=A0A7R9LGK0_9ACAR|nr:unnamed protein product [Oppiella nova]CAG2163469.1 unnamed protein product [Oppiella nova]